MTNTLEVLKRKMTRSIAKHGEWDDYTREEMMDKVIDEFKEVELALILNEMDGEHGAASELLDVAVTCIKMSYQITRRMV